MERFKTADAFYEKDSKNKEVLLKLRGILNKLELEETIKWGSPVYTWGGKNVIGVGSFKEYAGLWFFNGVYLNDDAKVLVNAQEGVTKALRQWRFDSVSEIDEDLVKAYCIEAIENQKAGKELKPEKKKLSIPEELQAVFKSTPALKKAFQGFSPGKQREFADHISQAKREATRSSRLEKIIPMIMEGRGLYEKYKNC